MFYAGVYNVITMLIEIISASLVGSVFALIGGVILLWRESFAKRISLLLVSFAIGSLTAAAFLELIPEAIAEAPYAAVAPWVVIGIFAIFLFEKVLHWYHVHEDSFDHPHDERQHNIRAVTATVLVGDGIHNFIDGLAIAVAWSVDTATGLATTMAVFLHEVPQEISDFGILVHLGYTRIKVFMYNFVTALTTPVGAVVGYLLLPVIQGVTPQLLGFAAGSFLYIAVSDLLPELHHHMRRRNDFLHLIAIALGVLSVWGLGILLPE